MTSILKQKADITDNFETEEHTSPPDCYLVSTPRGEEIVYPTDKVPVYKINDEGFSCEFTLDQVISDFTIGNLLGSIIKINIKKIYEDKLGFGDEFFYLFHYKGIVGVNAQKLMLTRNNLVKFLDDISASLDRYTQQGSVDENDYNDVSMQDIIKFKNWFAKTPRAKRYNPRYSHTQQFVDKYSAKRISALAVEGSTAG